MKLLKYIFLLSFILYPHFLVLFDTEKELLASQKNNSYAVSRENILFKNIQAQAGGAEFEILKIPTSEVTSDHLVNSKLISHTTQRTMPAIAQKILRPESIAALYIGLDLLDSNSFGNKLHNLIDTHYADADADAAIGSRQYSHYLIDRLVIESDSDLSYAQKQEKIQYLLDAAELSVTENQMKDEVNFLMNALAILPSGVKSPPWREGWYSRLQQWPEINEADHTEANRDVHNSHDDWRARVNDYQQVRGQLVLQLGDQQDIFEVAQEDLRNSYFTNKEVTVITITDNTIDLLNSINQ